MIQHNQQNISDNLVEYEDLSSVYADRDNFRTIVGNNDFTLLKINKLECNGLTYSPSVLFLIRKPNDVYSSFYSEYIILPKMASKYADNSTNNCVAIAFNLWMSGATTEYYDIHSDYIHIASVNDRNTYYADYNHFKNYPSVIDGNPDGTGGYAQIYPMYQSFITRYVEGSVSQNGFTSVGYDWYNKKMVEINYWSGETSTSITEYNMPPYNVLTESEYNALGDNVDSNTLYFITED